jgi:peptide-methionine (S)-S-oxide reductase
MTIRAHMLVMTPAAIAACALAVAGCTDRETNAMSQSQRQGQYDANQPAGQARQVATFAAGCFWGVEAAFRQLEGVTATAVGYTGGHVDEPGYKLVCTDTTGHAEAVRVEFDPEQVTYRDLLAVFWKAHDPTQVNRQGPDVGTQYRSAIFYHDDEQKHLAEQSKADLEASGRLSRPVATEIAPADTFWLAEDYHQQYLEKRGRTSCSATIDR